MVFYIDTTKLNCLVNNIVHTYMKITENHIKMREASKDITKFLCSKKCKF